MANLINTNLNIQNTKSTLIHPKSYKEYFFLNAKSTLENFGQTANSLYSSNILSNRKEIQPRRPRIRL